MQLYIDWYSWLPYTTVHLEPETGTSTMYKVNVSMIYSVYIIHKLIIPRKFIPSHTDSNNVWWKQTTIRKQFCLVVFAPNQKKGEVNTVYRSYMVLKPHLLLAFQKMGNRLTYSSYLALPGGTVPVAPIRATVANCWQPAWSSAVPTTALDEDQQLTTPVRTALQRNEELWCANTLC